MATNTGTISAFRVGNVMLRCRFAAFFLISGVLFGGADLAAQRPQLGISVQLPTIRNFSVQTAVSVPDGGTISLGGVTRSAEGRVSSGIPGLRGRPFRNDAIGRETSISRATVKARIISQRELEEDLLAHGDRKSRLRAEAMAYLNGTPLPGNRQNRLTGNIQSGDLQSGDLQSGDLPSGLDWDAPGGRASSRRPAPPSDSVAAIVRPPVDIESFANFLAKHVGRHSVPTALGQ